MTEWLRPDRRASREPRWFAADLALTAFFVWVTLASIRSSAYVDEFGPIEGAGVWLAVAPTLLLPLRRLAPATTLGAATVLYLVISASQGDSNAPLAIPFFAYSVGLTRPTAVSGAMVAASAAALSTTVFYGPGDPDALTVVVVFALYAIGWLLAISVRRSLERSEQLRLEALAMREDQERIASEAAADERHRIARELHDAVGHAVNVIVLQAGAARMSGDPDRALETLTDIEHVARDALTDLDDMLGLLSGDASAPTSPMRTSADIARLAADARAAGADITFENRGEVEWDRAVGTAVYRIVQEALTNALRHSRGAPVHIEVSSDAQCVGVRVSNPLPRDSVAGSLTDIPSTHGGGRGVPGMTERVHVVGGTIEVGPTSDGCFVVDARLPQRQRARRSNEHATATDTTAGRDR